MEQPYTQLSGRGGHVRGGTPPTRRHIATPPHPHGRSPPRHAAAWAGRLHVRPVVGPAHRRLPRPRDPRHPSPRAPRRVHRSTHLRRVSRASGAQRPRHRRARHGHRAPEPSAQAGPTGDLGRPHAQPALPGRGAAPRSLPPLRSREHPGRRSQQGLRRDAAGGGQRAWSRHQAHPDQRRSATLPTRRARQAGSPPTRRRHGLHGAGAQQPEPHRRHARGSRRRRGEPWRLPSCLPPPTLRPVTPKARPTAAAPPQRRQRRGHATLGTHDDRRGSTGGTPRAPPPPPYTVRGRPTSAHGSHAALQGARRAAMQNHPELRAGSLAHSDAPPRKHRPNTPPESPSLAAPPDTDTGRPAPASTTGSSQPRTRGRRSKSTTSLTCTLSKEASPPHPIQSHRPPAARAAKRHTALRRTRPPRRHCSAGPGPQRARRPQSSPRPPAAARGRSANWTSRATT